MIISGTFLDEITWDIPSANWGPEEWDVEFKTMKSVGIDTVILIRAGLGNKATYDSAVLRKHVGFILAEEDLVEMFLQLADKYDLAFFFGTYDSYKYWHIGEYQKEADINMEFCSEVWERYGHHKSFKGWYITFEISSYDKGMMNLYRQLATHLKSLKDMPVLMSPYIRGTKICEDESSVITQEEHREEWEKVFSSLEGKVNIVAFQDGHVDYDVLPEYLAINAELAKKYSFECWSNVETFDRDMPIKFPPINWQKLKYKMNAAQETGVEKLITFEFSHFLSPNSMYQSAHGLFKRYCEEFVK